MLSINHTLACLVACSLCCPAGPFGQVIKHKHKHSHWFTQQLCLCVVFSFSVPTVVGEQTLSYIHSFIVTYSMSVCVHVCECMCVCVHFLALFPMRQQTCYSYIWGLSSPCLYGRVTGAGHLFVCVCVCVHSCASPLQKKESLKGSSTCILCIKLMEGYKRG